MRNFPSLHCGRCEEFPPPLCNRAAAAKTGGGRAKGSSRSSSKTRAKRDGTQDLDLDLDQLPLDVTLLTASTKVWGRGEVWTVPRVPRPLPN